MKVLIDDDDLILKIFSVEDATELAKILIRNGVCFYEIANNVASTDGFWEFIIYNKKGDKQ